MLFSTGLAAFGWALDGAFVGNWRRLIGVGIAWLGRLEDGFRLLRSRDS